MMSANEFQQFLSLQPNPEGGFFAEQFRDESVILSAEALPPQFKVGRPVSTSIYYLLPSGSVSKLHRIPSAEVWHFYSGEPLTVFEIDEEGKTKHTIIGSDLAAGHKLQYAVPPMVWFGAYPTKDVPNLSDPTTISSRDPNHSFSLVGCTVAPGFQFEDFEMGQRHHLLASYPHAHPFIHLLTPADDKE